MACFLVPMGEAIVTTAASKIIDSYERKTGSKTVISEHLKHLNSMLWGGSAMLIFDHIKNGEITPYYPFFTADKSEILYEISTNGTAMALIVTAIWTAGFFIAEAKKKHNNILLNSSGNK